MTLPGAADVAIIGAGVVGTAIARTLAAYQLDCVLVDAARDVGTGTSKANTAILHTGFDAKPGTPGEPPAQPGLRAAARVRSSGAGSPVERTGALLVAWTPDQVAALPAHRGERAAQRVPGHPAAAGPTSSTRGSRALGPGALGGLEIPDESII